MKKWWWIAAVMVLTLLLSACGGQPIISLAESNLDFGDVVKGEVVVREIGVQNEGRLNH